MADNVTLNPGSGGAPIATDDIGGVHYARSKIVLGANGVNDGDVASGNPLPVTASALPLPSGAATGAKQDTQQTALDAIKAAVELLDNTVSGTELQVDVLTSGLPTGASTSAKQDLAQAALDAIKTAVETLDNAISGAEMQVDVVAPLPAGTNKVGAVDLDSDATLGSAVPAIAQYIAGSDGTNARGIKTDASGELQVDIVGSLPAGTNAIGKLSSNTGVDIGDVDVLSIAAGDNNIGNVDVVSGPTGASALAVQGTVAHDSAAAQNPVQVGAEARATERAGVASADVARLVCDLVGRLVQAPHCVPEQTLRGATSAITGTSDTEVIAAQAAGVRIYVTTIVIANSHATVNTVVALKDGSGGTVLMNIPAACLCGGAVIQLAVPLRLTAATGLYAACLTTGANVYVSAVGYAAA